MGRLAGMGFPVTALPLAGTSKETGTARLQPARLVFVTGGNASRLLRHAILRLCRNLPEDVAGEAVGIGAGLLLRGVSG